MHHLRTLSRAGMPADARARRLVASLFAVLIAGAVFVALLAIPNGAAGAASTPGVSGNSVTLGLVTSVTGAASSSFGQDTVNGAKARVALANANGGVNGRKIKLVTVDDASTPAQDLTAVKTLIQKDHSFAVLDASSDFTASYRYTLQQGVPVLGAGIDGPEWGVKANSNLFSVISGSVNPHYPGFQSTVNFFKSIGAKKIGVVAVGQAPSAVGSMHGVAKVLQKSGFDVVVQDYTPPFTQTNFTSDAVAMKQKGVDAIATAMVTSQNLGLVTALRQQGVNLKGEDMVASYDQNILNVASSRAAAQGVDFQSKFAIPPTNLPATKTLMATLKKYTGYNKPSFTEGQMWGWATADAAIKGLQVAGKNFTRSSYIKSLRNVHNYNMGGLLGGPIDFSKWAFYNDGAGGNCFYIGKVSGSKFVAQNHGKPFCGGPVSGTNGA